jgi:hypothetical protein
MSPIPSPARPPHARRSSIVPFVAIAPLVQGLALSVTSLVAAAPAAIAQNCANSSIGQTPLDDLRSGLYLGEEGGLYPGGAYVDTSGHASAGVNLAKKVEPLADDGTPDSKGRIGVVSIGFSLANQTFDGFLAAIAGDTTVNSAITFVNCAYQQQDADVIADPTSDYWTTIVPGLLKDGGLDARQVEVVWLMTGLKDDAGQPFPDHAQALTDLFVAIAQNLKTYFPHVRQCFVSSIPYMGYSLNGSGAEPYYFEQGFAQKWLVERQLDGDATLEWDAEKGTVVAPWLAWGPYYWCDGIVPRSDGFTWLCTDVGFDGTHPSPDGQVKLGERLRHFFESEPAAVPWFLASGASPHGRPAHVELYGDGTTGSAGEPLISVSELPTIPTSADYLLVGLNGVSRGSGWFLLGDELDGGSGTPFAKGRLYPDALFVLPVAFDKRGRGAVDLGPIPDDPTLAGVTWYAQLVTLDGGGPNGKLALSCAIAIEPGD